jgi:urease beta subunit
MIPGQIIPAGEPVEINANLPVTTVTITNTGEIPVHLTAHFHVFEANPRLAFDRRQAWGMRLDVPANGSVRIEPGETRQITLVPIGGNRVIHGFNGTVNGPLDRTDVNDALAYLIERGFQHRER